MKTITSIDNLIPEHYFGVAEQFLIAYIGRYTAERIDKCLEVFEISCSIDDQGEFWSRPIRFISDGSSQYELAGKIIEKSKEKIRVSHNNPTGYLGGGIKLLYRDVKDLPCLKLQSW